jgi:hypothetical protein
MVFVVLLHLCCLVHLVLLGCCRLFEYTLKVLWCCCCCWLQAFCPVVFGQLNWCGAVDLAAGTHGCSSDPTSHCDATRACAC